LGELTEEQLAFIEAEAEKVKKQIEQQRAQEEEEKETEEAKKLLEQKATEILATTESDRAINEETITNRIGDQLKKITEFLNTPARRGKIFSKAEITTIKSKVVPHLFTSWFINGEENKPINDLVFPCRDAQTNRRRQYDVEFKNLINEFNKAIQSGTNNKLDASREILNFNEAFDREMLDILYNCSERITKLNLEQQIANISSYDIAIRNERGNYDPTKPFQVIINSGIIGLLKRQKLTAIQLIHQGQIQQVPLPDVDEAKHTALTSDIEHIVKYVIKPGQLAVCTREISQILGLDRSDTDRFVNADFEVQKRDLSRILSNSSKNQNDMLMALGNILYMCAQ
jgi:hypothetical protein